MAGFPKEQYEINIRDRRRKALGMALSGISSLQRWARTLFKAESPPFARRASFCPPPEDDLLTRLCSTIDALKLADVTFDRPQYVNVEAEWVFSSEAAAQETSMTGPLILFIHGGGFLYGSPATARRVTHSLAALSGGCCLAPQYRYATEQPFPAQILDALVVYFSLLSSGISNHRIVFAGESSGLSLLMAMTQMLLHLQRDNEDSRLRFCGQDLSVQLPAAVAGLSGFFDVTNGLPSWNTNGRWDVLRAVQEIYLPTWEDQDVWPANPARADVYCERSAMVHPLVSPVTAKNWRGAPPFFIAVGEERCADANLFLAQTAAIQGVRVRLECWEHMTHVWSTAFPKLPHSKRILEHWARFCSAAVDSEEEVQTQGWSVSFETMEATPFDVLTCTSLQREEVLRCMREAQRSRLLVRRKGQEGAKI